jgi:hypothetical protein
VRPEVGGLCRVDGGTGDLCWLRIEEEAPGGLDGSSMSDSVYAKTHSRTATSR